jgi:hypothetical protein
MKRTKFIVFNLLLLFLSGCVTMGRVNKFGYKRCEDDSYHQRNWTIGTGMIATGILTLEPLIHGPRVWKHALLYSEVVYKRIGNKWYPWVMVAPVVIDDEKCAPEFFWEDEKYIYISRLIKVIEPTPDYDSGEEYKNAKETPVMEILKINKGFPVIEKRRKFNIRHGFYRSLYSINIVDNLIYIIMSNFNERGYSIIKADVTLESDLYCGYIKSKYYTSFIDSMNSQIINNVLIIESKDDDKINLLESNLDDIEFTACEN